MKHRTMRWLLMTFAGLLTATAPCRAAGPADRVLITPGGIWIPPQAIAASYSYAWHWADAMRHGDAEVRIYMRDVPGWNAAHERAHMHEMGFPFHTWVLRDGMIIHMWPSTPVMIKGWGNHAFTAPWLHPNGWHRQAVLPGDGTYYVILWPPTLKFNGRFIPLGMQHPVIPNMPTMPAAAAQAHAMQAMQQAQAMHAAAAQARAMQARPHAMQAAAAAQAHAAMRLRR